MALSPQGQFSRNLNTMVSFYNFRYQSTHKNMLLNILLREKRKISLAEGQWNFGILSFGVKQQNPFHVSNRAGTAAILQNRDQWESF